MVTIMEKAFKCNSCSEKFSSIRKLNAHMRSQHNGVHNRQMEYVNCSVCRHDFRGGTSLIKHMRTHTGERPYKCEVQDCGFAFKQESTLNAHIRYKHSEDRPFKCDFPGCFHAAKTSENLYQHKDVHSDERPFACPISGCSFRAKRSDHLKIHVAGIHTEAKAFACSKCDYKAAYKGNLTVHMRRHSTRRDFKCSHPQCNQSFKSAYELKSHFSYRHGERNIQCDVSGCGHKFANAKSLRRHKSDVHLKKIKSCPSDNCGYTTNNAQHLARHLLAHEGRNEKIPCSIEGCGHKARNMGAMERHMHRHQTLLPCTVSGCGRFVPNEETLKEHVKLHNPSGRPFQCPLCFKHFPTLDQLQMHCVIHTNEKPFQCGHCDRGFSRRYPAQTHISSVHPNVDFPVIVHLLDDRECLRCKMILSSAEFVAHCKGHVGS